MNICQLRDHDVADGPGIRVGIYVSGCVFKCEDCHNQEAWDFEYGERYNIYHQNEILTNIAKEYIDGISILGGEPLHPNNLEGVLDICRMIKTSYHHDRTIWIWTGYTAEELIDRLKDYDTKHRLALDENTVRLHEILYLSDVIVDGRYDKTKKNLNLKFRGSSNQRILKSRELLDKKIEIIPDSEI